MSSGKKVTLSTGYEIPQLGYGTWQAAPGEVGNGVYEALKAGYKHLDLAKIYENQKEVAQGIKKAFAEIPGLKREDIFITSKLWNTQHDPKHVEAALDDTLAELELDYLDLYLVHWPVSFGPGKDPHSDLFPLASANEVYIDSSVSNVETWKAVTKLPKSKVRSVGVSNFTVENLKTLIEKSGIVPAVNQIERHPILRSKELIAFAKEKNIHITAYSAFGNNFFDIPLLITRPEIKAIADKIGATPAQVILAWSQVGGHSVIPKSVTPTRIRENFQEIELSAEDVAAIEKMGEEHQGRRRYNVPYTANKPRWDINIFNEPEEQAATNGVVL